MAAYILKRKIVHHTYTFACLIIKMNYVDQQVELDKIKPYEFNTGIFIWYTFSYTFPAFKFMLNFR